MGANVFTVQVDATGGSDAATLNITVDAAPIGWTEIIRATIKIFVEPNSNKKSPNFGSMKVNSDKTPHARKFG